MRDLAIEGAGIALLPSVTAAAALARVVLVTLPRDHAPVTHVLAAVIQPAYRLSPKLRLLIDAFAGCARRPLAEWGSAG